MRRSLPLRLLGLSLAVAALAIAATAWLTTRDASERFRGEFERTLEADTFIYNELTKYAVNHDSWDGVDEVVDNIARRTGRRVALTTPDGDLLVDSMALAGHGGSPLPSNATAQIDPLAPIMAGETTQVRYGGDTMFVESMSEADYTKLEMVESLGHMTFTRSGVPLTWRMTEEERDLRRDLAAEAEQCLQEAFDTDDRVLVTVNGEIVVVDSTFVESLELGPQISEGEGSILGDQLDSLSFSVLGERLHPCLPDELLRPSQAALDFNAAESALLHQCLDENGLDYDVRETDAGLIQTVPESLPEQEVSESVAVTDDEPAGTHVEHSAGATWTLCLGDAGRMAMEGFVAEPALLFTGASERFDPFFGDGWWRTSLAGVAVLVAATGITALAGRRMTRPIHALTAAAQRMESGDRAARVDVRGRDEIAQLGEAFNSMAEAIEANEAQRKAMVSDVAHELRTPLANVRGYLEAAQDGVVPTDPELISSLLEESALLERLITDLQQLALADAGMLRIYPELRDASELTRQVAAAHGSAAEEAGVTLAVEEPSGVGAGGDGAATVRDIVVEVDAERLRQALGNLVTNAIRFTPEGGTVTLLVNRENDAAVFAVRDDGPGISEEHLPRIFDRFYRVESSRSRETGGSGLGLAIAKHLVEEHGGSIDVISVEGEGSTFTIRLPLAATTLPT